MTKRMSKREQKALEEFAAIAGMDPEQLKAMRVVDDYPHSNKSAQVDIALHYIRQPQGYAIKKCVECKETFGTNYYHVAFCSDTCRAKDFERHFKIPYGLSGKGQREKWGGEVPLIIAPWMMKNVKTMLEQIQEAERTGQILVQEEDQTANDLEDLGDEESAQKSSQAETQDRPEFLQEWEGFDPEFEFEAAKTSSEVDTNPQPSPSEADPFGLPDLPSFSLFD